MNLNKVLESVIAASDEANKCGCIKCLVHRAGQRKVRELGGAATLDVIEYHAKRGAAVHALVEALPAHGFTDEAYDLYSAAADEYGYPVAKEIMAKFREFTEFVRERLDAYNKEEEEHVGQFCEEKKKDPAAPSTVGETSKSTQPAN